LFGNQENNDAAFIHHAAHNTRTVPTAEHNSDTIALKHVIPQPNNTAFE
jgi:hypothetical protein